MRHLPLRPLALALVISGLCSQHVHADTVPQTLPFAQNWSNAGLISANDNWSGVPGIMGYRGDILTAANDVDPQTVLSSDSVVDVNANQTAPNTFTTGGVTEFAIANPTIALTGSGTADAPSLVIHLNTVGQQSVQISYLLRDLDGSTDNATQQVALQYRVGSTGNFVNVPAGYVADATTGPSLSDVVTAVSVTLPAAADNQAEVQVRIITTNANGNDEWVGVDDISVTGTPIGGSVNAPVVTSCPSGFAVTAGASSSVNLSATDADSIVNGAAITSSAVSGISLGALNAATAEGGTATVPVNVTGLAAGSYPVTVNFSNDEAQSSACTLTVTVTPAVSVTTIPQIQGSGSTSPLAGQSVTTEGVVTKVTNNGFFLQDMQGDNNASTSDGIFVFTSTTPSAQVAEGNALRVIGTVTEFAVGTGTEAVARPVTQIVSPTVTLLSTGNVVLPVPLVLPESTEGELERYEGMLVTIQAPLTASQNFFQGRYGQVTLGAGGRLHKPTNLYPAGSTQAMALADDNARRRILLDDGTSQQNKNPTPYIGADNTLRAGDTVSGVTGVIDYGLATNFTDGISDYKIHPTQPVVFSRDNPRTVTPPDVGGNVRVGSFNVLNFFTTIDQAGSAGCFPSGTRSDCRGADSSAEFQRQRNKIIPAILGLNADVVGLMEIENNGNAAVQNLVNGLNAVAGAGTYAAIALPTGGTGTDAIRVAMIYKPTRVSPVGSPLSDTAAIHNRPPLAQTFSAANGEAFTVVVNHFKSKGSCPSSAADVDADQGDGQGCWNDKRTQQAQALASFLSGMPNAVIVGDLNAYGKEDPILALSALGFDDQIARFNPQGYSYVFDGEAGYLDHALVSSGLSAKVSGASHWRINADEPSIIDYNTEFKVGDPNCSTSCSPDYYTNSVYRSSDHDPVVVGLNLYKNLSGTTGRDVINGTAGDDVIQAGLGADTLTGGLGADRFVYGSLRDGTDIITDFQAGVDLLDVSAVLQSLGVNSANPLSSGHVSCVASGSSAVVHIDPDGTAGAAAARPLIRINNLGCTMVTSTGNFVF